MSAAVPAVPVLCTLNTGTIECEHEITALQRRSDEFDTELISKKARPKATLRKA